MKFNQNSYLLFRVAHVALHVLRGLYSELVADHVREIEHHSMFPVVVSRQTSCYLQTLN